MANAQGLEMDASDLRPADEKILDELQDGARTKGYLVDATGFSRNTIYNRLEVLEAAEFIEEVHDSTRLFQLVVDPRHYKYQLHPVVRAWYEARNPKQGVVQSLNRGIGMIQDATEGDEELALIWRLTTWFDSEMEGEAGPGWDQVEYKVDQLLGDLQEDTDA